jgi:hypothetical protein
MAEVFLEGSGSTIRISQPWKNGELRGTVCLLSGLASADEVESKNKAKGVNGNPGPSVADFPLSLASCDHPSLEGLEDEDSTLRCRFLLESLRPKRNSRRKE